MSTSLTLDRLSSSSGSQNAHSSTEVPEIEQSTVRVSKAGGSVLQPQVLFRRWWCARRARAWWRRRHRDQARTKPGGIGDVQTRVTSSRRTSGTVSGSRPSWLVRRPRPPFAPSPVALARVPTRKAWASSARVTCRYPELVTLPPFPDEGGVLPLGRTTTC